MKKQALFLIFLFNISYVLASSISIFNDSPYTLHAEISDATGTVKGKVQIARSQHTTWTDHDYNAKWSLSPYTVTFLCKNNKIYGVYGNVSPGSLVSASQSSGPKYCEKERKKKEQHQTSNLVPEDFENNSSESPSEQ